MSADLWTDLAVWVGPTVNEAGPMDEHRGVVLHIADGTYQGTIDWQKNPSAQVSSHFVVAEDGRIAQVVPANSHTAWTQQNGNGHWISVENEGFTPAALTAQQVVANAKILARAHQLYGAPLQVATSPLGRGLGHHSMGTNGHNIPTDTWTGPTWGHEECPGPAIVAQKQQIIDLATQIVNGVVNVTAPVVVDMLNSKTQSGISLNNFVTAMWGRVVTDMASRFDQVLAAANNDAQTPVTIADDARAQLVSDLEKAVHDALGTGGGQPPTDSAAIATAVCDEMDARQRARLGS